MASIDILLPTYNRPASLVMTLTGVAAQTFRDVRVVVSEQSEGSLEHDPIVQALRRIIALRGGALEWHHRPPVHGIAEQRHFLLSRARADLVLYLDDDVLMDSAVLKRMVATIGRERCAFVGAFPISTSYREDLRPEQQVVELWEGPVRPEAVDPDTSAWERWHLHRACNLIHAAGRMLKPGEHRLYKVAWVASCVLYERKKLEAVGGFSFWSRLPRYHSGEEVLVQNLLMRRWGGCAIMPSGTYSAEVDSTVLNERGTVDGHALMLLPEMIARYAPPQERESPLA
ncbi:MAG TPA: glycosyltransferase [Nitrospira sp.]|nr:glycosyltransferase [Nitrospira sp.]